MLNIILTLAFLLSISISFSVGANINADISLVLRRLEVLEQKVQTLETENDLLKGENRRVLNTLKSVQEELEMVKTSQIYPTDGTNTDSENTIFLHKAAPEENQTSRLDKQAYSSTHDSINERNRKTTHIVNQKQKRLLTGTSGSTTSSRIVAFRASLAKPILSLGSHQAVEYDEVPLNVGNAYDARHGHFIAPVKGLYLMSLNMFADYGKQDVLDVVKNGNQIDIIHADGRPSAYGSQSKVFPVILEKGDMVWTRTRPGFEGEQLYGSPRIQHNMFAAVLLQEL